ncbi:hypothetical protein MN608_08257 [Microdochium nivale]|nr:hypothetical protein MN608_08257 [Microdochium nivale]
MDTLPASHIIVRPSGSDVDVQARPVASSPSVTDPSGSSSPHAACAPTSPSTTAKLLGDNASSLGSMCRPAGGSAGSAAAATTTSHLTPPAVFFNLDARLYRDGRVRDPVPSKLKGVPRDLSGNFAVMHMDVNSHLKSKGRDAAAKHTSESTALQARLASTPSYVSHHRRANYPKPTGSKPHAVTTSLLLRGQLDSSKLSPTPTSAPLALAVDQDLVMVPLASREVKSEQARLLTLLRTLPPSTVVDQFCKALAFFGGIPEAPPPADGRFPESGEANGPGSLFVGWLSEIFPNLDQPRRPVPRPPLQPTAQTTSPPVPHSVKRPRGRPKGSKASKVRSDKGVKKGPVKSARKPANAPAASLPGYQQDSFAAINVIPSEANTAAHGYFMNGPTGESAAVGGSQHPSSSAPLPPSSHPSEISPTPGKRRGRPKGSKNRPKDITSAETSAQPRAQQPPATSNLQPRHEILQQPQLTYLPQAHLPRPLAVKDHVAQQADTDAAQASISGNCLKKISDFTLQDTSTQRQRSTETVLAVNAEGPVPDENCGHAVNTGTAAEKIHRQIGEKSSIDQPKVKESSIVGLKRKRQIGQGSHASKTIAHLSSTTPQVEMQAPRSPSMPRSQATRNEDILAQGVVRERSSEHKKKRSRNISTASSSKLPGDEIPNGIEHQDPGISISSVDALTSGVGSAAAIVGITTHVDTSPNTQHVIYEGVNPSTRVAPNNKPGGNEQNPQQNPPLSFSDSSTAHGDMRHTSENMNGRSTHSYSARQGEQVVAAARKQISISPPPQSAALSQIVMSSQAAAAHSSQRQHQQQQQQRQQRLHQEPSQPQRYRNPSATYLAGQSMDFPSRAPQPSRNDIRQHGVPNGSVVRSISKPHLANSPQFRSDAQGISSFIPVDGGSFNGSSGIAHENTPRASQRPVSTTSIDNHPYRPSNPGLHVMNRHTTQQIPRQQSAVGVDSPSTLSPPALQSMSPSFGEFPDSHLFGLQDLDTTDGHHGLGLHNTSYDLNMGHNTHLPRETGSSSGPSYSTAADMGTYMAHANLGQANHQNRWHS